LANKKTARRYFSIAKTVERMLKRTAAELGLAQCLEGPPVRTLQGAFAGSMGRWAMS
jgi:hypothetical protein